LKNNELAFCSHHGIVRRSASSKVQKASRSKKRVELTNGSSVRRFLAWYFHLIIFSSPIIAASLTSRHNKLKALSASLTELSMAELEFFFLIFIVQRSSDRKYIARSIFVRFCARASDMNWIDTRARAQDTDGRRDMRTHISWLNIRMSVPRWNN